MNDLPIINCLHFVDSKDGFTVYFNPNTQSYSVYKDGAFIIGNKYRYSDVKSYVE